MRIEAKTSKHGLVAAVVEFRETDAVALATVLSYARNAIDDMPTQRLYERLCAIAEALSMDADAYMTTRGKPYHDTRRKLDPNYGGEV